MCSFMKKIKRKVGLDALLSGLDRLLLAVCVSNPTPNRKKQKTLAN